MYECYAKKTVGGTELSSGGKIALLGKRKWDNKEDNDKEQEKSKGKDKKARLQPCDRMMKTLIFRMLNLGYGSWKTVMIWSQIFRVL
jgi:hypothetical protein